MHVAVTEHTAEELLIGCILDRPSLFTEIPLRDGLWSDERCRTVHAFLAQWQAEGRPLEAIPVQSALMRCLPGLVNWAMSVLTAIPGPDSWPYWFQTARLEAAKRHRMRLSTELAHADTPHVKRLLARRIEGLARAEEEIDDPTAPKRLTTGGNAEVAKALAYMEGIVERSPAFVGIRTGLPTLDRLTGGFKRKELWVIAGRPGEGKTTLAVQFLSTLSKNHPCAFFSLEMSSEELITAMAHCESGVPRSILMEGCQDDVQLGALGKALGSFSERGLFMFDRLSTLDAITAQARKEVRLRGVRFVLIDYLQRVQVPKAKDRWAAIGAVSNALKDLAMELDVTVIALAQIGRDAEREGRPARLADLRGSGEIEADADVVGLIGREDDSRHLTLAKVRRGRVGRVPLYIDFDRARILEASKVDAP